MTKEQQEAVMGIVDNEGFDYAFCDYTDFDTIEDAEFHEARKKYVKYADELKRIIGFYEY